LEVSGAALGGQIAQIVLGSMGVFSDFAPDLFRADEITVAVA
jgi:hypothetical protein